MELGPQADLQENCRRGHADAEKALSNPHEAALAADVLESLIAVHGDLSILAFRSAFRIGKPDQCNATHALVISRKWLPKPETVRVQFVLKGILVASYEYLAKEFDFLGLAAYLADGKGRKFPEPEVDIFGGIVLVVEGERASLMRGERSPLSSRCESGSRTERPSTERRS